ncbi:MAG: DNRLRE domain-containing protein [Candidatus Limnocylindria bacterium]
MLLGLLLGGGLGIGWAAGLNLGSQALTPYRTCTITATPATTTTVIDANVRQGSPGSNFGTVTTIAVSSGVNVNQRVHLRFDLSQCSPAIPTTATVRLATLRLYASALPAACRTIDLFRVTASWTEIGITWTNQPFGDTLNNPPNASRTGSFAVGTPTGCQNRAAGYVVGGTVTGDVAAFVAGGATNFGWMLRDDVEGSSTTRTTTFSAKNLGIVAQAPQLVITYVTVP